MSKFLRCALLAWGITTLPMDLPGRDIPLVAGNLIQCVVTEPDFSPRTAQKGDPLVCYARPLREFGCSGFPRGTQVAGRLIDYRQPGRLIGKGWMLLQFDRLVLPDAETTVSTKVVGAQGFRVDRTGKILGRGHPKRDAAGWMIPILWPVKLITVAQRGPTPALKGERLITLRLLDDLQVPCESFRPSVSSSTWRPLPSSSTIGPGSLNSPDESTPEGVWRRFDGSIVGGQDNSSRGQAIRNDPRPEGNGAPLKPDRLQSADLASGSPPQASRKDRGDLVVDMGTHTLTVGSSWPSRPAPKVASSSPQN